MRTEEQRLESEVLRFQGCSCDSAIKTRTSGSQTAACGLRDELGVHRPPSPPWAALHPRAEPWKILPAGMSFTCLLPICAINVFVFHVPPAADSQMLWVCTVYLRPFQAKLSFKVCEWQQKMSQSGTPCEQSHCEFGLFVCFLNNVGFFSPPPPWVPTCKKTREATFSESHHCSSEETTAVRTSWCY